MAASTGRSRHPPHPGILGLGLLNRGGLRDIEEGAGDPKKDQGTKGKEQGHQAGVRANWAALSSEQSTPGKDRGTAGKEPPESGGAGGNGNTLAGLPTCRLLKHLGDVSFALFCLWTVPARVGLDRSPRL